MYNKKHEETRNTTRHILGSHSEPLPYDVIANLPKRSVLERLVRNRRAQAYPGAPVPTNLVFEIPQEYENIVLHDSGSGHDRIIAIGSRELIPYLNSDVWMGDGTFKLCPTIFFQLYTIHAKVGSSYPPCLYFLLPRKNKETYDRMNDILHNLVPNAHSSGILVDMEIAAINSFTSKFPNANISTCHFHLCQAVIHKVLLLGLKHCYETDPEFRIVVKCLCSFSHF